jgi:N-acylneuraminate cytidylyltransferase
MRERQKRIIAFIPLREGSETIPLKNIKKIAGRPLVYWILDAACDCDLIDKIYVSTDSEAIRRVVADYGNEKIEVVSRSRETATATASTESAMIEFAKKYDFTTIILIQATSPLTEAIHLTEGITKYFSEKADSLVSVVRQKRFIWECTDRNSVKPVNYDPFNRPRRQDFQGVLVENGAFYITSKKNLLKTSSRLSGRIVCYEMPEETYFELDSLFDWIVIEHLLLEKKAGRYNTALGKKLRKIKLLIMDVDGVMTDAGMYYSEKGDELKRFNARDGKGVEFLRYEGIKTAIFTGENTSLVAARAKKLKVDILIQGAGDKASVLRKIVKKYRLKLENIAYIGDDINDYEVMEMVGFSAVPADGILANKRIASYICTKKGGEGCIREVCDLLIEARRR